MAPRLYAIAHVLDGVSRAKAARLCGMDRQALRDAVVRFNAEGMGGLVDRPQPGREPRLSEGEQAALAGLILRSPRPEQSGLSSWTLADLCQEVEANWGKRFHTVSMSRIVRSLGFSRQKARQVHPQSDAQAQAAFAKRGSSTHSTTWPRPTPASESRSGFRTKPGSVRKAAPAIAGG